MRKRGIGVRSCEETDGGCLLLVTMVALLSCLAGCKPDDRSGIIVGGSMTPVFLGEHIEAICPDCQFMVKCNATLPESQTNLVCPNCGCSNIAISDGELRSAERVKIELDPAPIHRWDVIAFQIPDSNIAGIKRVVGLPNEHLTIDGGNLYINGALLRKPIALQKQMRIAVNDSQYSAESRWTPEHPSSSWSSGFGAFHSGAFQFRPTDDALGWDTLIFRPRRCYAHRRTGSQPVFIEDYYGYNQSLARDLNATDELFMSAEIAFAPSAKIGVVFVHRSRRYQFEIDIAANEFQVWGFTDQQSLKTSLFDSMFESGKIQLEFSTIDQQMIVLINGEPIFNESLPMPDGSVSPLPIALRAKGGNVTIHRIQIWRDVYYLPPPQHPGFENGLQSSDTGYLVLGDNSPVSDDSRHWHPPEIDPESIIGRVIVDKNN